MPKKLHLIGNAHIDPVWLWPWAEGFQEVLSTFRSALDRLVEDPDFKFSASSAAFYEWVEQSDPGLFTQIQQKVREGRWELAGGWWVEPDCNIPSGESFARHGLLGQRYFQEKFGRMARVGYAPDSFGHNGNLPQILNKSGMDFYVFMRPSPHEKALPGRLFWWQSEDGSRVLAFRIPFEYCSWGKELDLHVERCAAEIKSPVEALMCFYGVGNHGGGPTQENLASLHRLQLRPDLPHLVFGTMEGYFNEVESQGWDLPVVTSDLQHHASGCYAAHSEVKRWNRRAENLLLSAEKWAAAAQVWASQPYPLADFRQAWKNVLFNQFHDILAGTSLETTYEDARNLYGEAQALAGRGLNLALQGICGKINIPAQGGGKPLVVFNPHGWASRVSVELEMGGMSGEETLLDSLGKAVLFQQVQSQATAIGRSRLAFVADLPPLGYAMYRLVALEQLPSSKGWVGVSDTVLENDRYRLEIDPQSGTIAALRDKCCEHDVFAGPGAQPLVVDDPSDTWSHNVFRFDKVVGSFTPVSVRLVEQGPLKGVIRVISSYNQSMLIQEFALYRDLENIEVRVRLDWREHFKLLKLRFPLNLERMRTFAEIPFGVIERQFNGEEEPCQGWVDVSGFSPQNGMAYGVSLLNDSKYSYDVNHHEVSLTVLRSPVYAHHIPATISPDKVYSFIDQGFQAFRYVILPHAGSWENAGTFRHAAELNQEAVVMAAAYHPGSLPPRDSFLEVGPENIALSAFKLSEDGKGWIVRAYETSRQAVEGWINVHGLNRRIETHFKPAEIKTFYLPLNSKLPVHEVNLLEE